MDETVASLDAAGHVVPREGNVGAPVDSALTTKVVPFNDLDAVRAALAPHDVAVVLTEPAMTNVGMVLPTDGFLKGLEEACAETGETHTMSMGPGGCVRVGPDAGRRDARQGLIAAHTIAFTAPPVAQFG